MWSGYVILCLSVSNRRQRDAQDQRILELHTDNSRLKSDILRLQKVWTFSCVFLPDFPGNNFLTKLTKLVYWLTKHRA